MLGFFTTGAFLFLAAVASASGCGENKPTALIKAFMDLRDAQRATRSYGNIQEQASWLGIDLDDDAQISQLACDLVGANVKSIGDIVDLLQLSPQDAQFAPMLIETFYYSLSTDLTVWPQVMEKIDNAKKFLLLTGFPRFPLGKSESSIQEAMEEVGDQAVVLIFDSYPSESLQKALATAQSVDEFNAMTYGAYEDAPSKTMSIQAEYDLAKHQYELESNLYDLLAEYGLLDIFE